MDMFGSLQQGVWINHYAGISTVGDRYVFTLGHNGKEYKGILQNVNKNEVITAEGNYKSEEIKLVLQDANQEFSGYLFGELQGSGVLVQILDSRKEKGQYIEFEKVNRDGFKVLDCPGQVWYRSYHGTMNQTPVFIQLQKERDQRLFGTVSVPLKQTGYIVSGSCDETKCFKMNLNLHDYFGERFKEYKVTTPELNRLQAEEFYKDKFQIVEDWYQENQFKFFCKNISVTALRLYAQYIQIGDREFDSWIDAFITKWTEQVISFYQPGDLQEQKDANANMDIDWISQDWVSGIFRFNEPWSEVERGLAFTYDRKLNRIIGMEEIFDKDFDYKLHFADLISKKKKEMMRSNTSNRFKAYLELEYFGHWTLRPEGFCFTSEFNSVWGMRKIIIPYSELQQHIRKSGPLRKLY